MLYFVNEVLHSFLEADRYQNGAQELYVFPRIVENIQNAELIDRKESKMDRIENVYDKVVLFSDKDDGTYDYLTEQTVEYDDGYQVSFVRPEAFVKLSKQQWDSITNQLCEYLESVVHIGVYGGSAEVSFHCIPKDKALETMVKYNQESILDWRNKKLFPQTTESWFIFNRLFDESGSVDYDEIIKQIQ